MSRNVEWSLGGGCFGLVWFAVSIAMIVVRTCLSLSFGKVKFYRLGLNTTMMMINVQQPSEYLNI